MTKKIRTYSASLKAIAVKKIADNNGNVSVTTKQPYGYERLYTYRVRICHQQVYD